MWALDRPHSRVCQLFEDVGEDLVDNLCLGVGVVLIDRSVFLAHIETSAEHEATLVDRVHPVIGHLDADRLFVEAGLKLVDAVQTLHEELKKSAQDDNDELAAQAAKYSELQATANSLEEDAQKAQRELDELQAQSESLEKRAQESETKLAETSDLLAKEQSQHEELRKSVQYESDQLDTQASKVS